ncbi:restriction endonuclease subunit S [Chryseobacterium sp. CFS15]|uniref:restriction endonuclease subunit S n=1 Tax=Chryseobacterium sp. CFS15 TaxID=2986946 RepID=UPI002807C392|nr:restriction endonuclease subunit S [Chryseobacterium sp. CFS15]MDQ8141485.1 restriction endonuclease subunit S [Chryseobacterium sp. CFS15]
MDDTHKETGLKYIGKIPKTWHVDRCKNIFDFISRGTSPNYVNQSSFKVVNQATFSRGYFNENEIKFTSKIGNLNSYLRKNDILIASTGGGVLGKTYFFDIDKVNYIADSHITIIRSKQVKINTKFYFYFFSINFHLINNLLALGSTNQTELQKKYLNDLLVVVPQYFEQTEIVNFLDIETKKIDKKIEILLQKIKIYQFYKKTIINNAVTKGINFVADKKICDLLINETVPQNWKIKRLKDISKSLSSGTTPKSNNQNYYNSGTVNWLNTGDLNDDIINMTSKKLNKIVFNDYPNLKIQEKGTLVIAMYGATIGKLGILGIPSTTNQACCCISFKKDQNTKFHFYQLLSLKTHLLSLSIGGTQPNISQSIISFLKLLVPPLEEQIEIANYLDQKTSKINNIIYNIQKQIGLLKEYRKTLINDAITGKIKV